MSTSMISTILEIEREAENVLKKAEEDSCKLLSDAKSSRDAAVRDIEEATKKEIAALEAKAKTEREQKVRELTANGETALAAVASISPAAFDAGVRHIMAALAKKA